MNCAVCGRPLKSLKSVAAGMGPTCAKKSNRSPSPGFSGSSPQEEIKVGRWNGYASLVSKSHQYLTIFKTEDGQYGVEPFALKWQNVPLLHTATSLGEAQQWAKEYLMTLVD